MHKHDFEDLLNELESKHKVIKDLSEKEAILNKNCQTNVSTSSHLQFAAVSYTRRVHLYSSIPNLSTIFKTPSVSLTCFMDGVTKR